MKRICTQLLHGEVPELFDDDNLEELVRKANFPAPAGWYLVQYNRKAATRSLDTRRTELWIRQIQPLVLALLGCASRRTW